MDTMSLPANRRPDAALPALRCPPIVGPTATALRAASGALAAGRLVALPTETVYGLAGAAGDALAGLFNRIGVTGFSPAQRAPRAAV